MKFEINDDKIHSLINQIMRAVANYWYEWPGELEGLCVALVKQWRAHQQAIL